MNTLGGVYTPEQEQTCRAEQDRESGRGRYLNNDSSTTGRNINIRNVFTHYTSTCAIHNWLVHAHTMSDTDCSGWQGHKRPQRALTGLLLHTYTHTYYVHT